ncbi:MAG: DUF881 domain-containing protein [Chloroflexi bacterium]|nr:DUF881 domain-containing protein [Chloroflexota bacterium]
MLRDRQAQLWVTGLCFLLGLLLVVQLRTQRGIAKQIQTQSPLDQARVISDLLDNNTRLYRQIDELEVQIAKSQFSSAESNLKALVADLNRLRAVNGLVEVAGPGVEIRVGGEISAADMQDLLNELRNAGAEAISLNDSRIVVSSVALADRGSLAVNGQRLKAPYVLRAIGHPETLDRAIERKGGLVPILRYNYPSVPISLVRSERLVLPISEGKARFAIARPVPAGQ